MPVFAFEFRQGVGMFKITGAAVLVLASAAAAQAGGHATAHFTASPSPYGQAGVAGIPDTSGFGPVPYVPPTQFAVQAVSGNPSEYTPSTFVSYDSAVSEGQALLAAQREPLGTSARAGHTKDAKNAEIHIVQNQAHGVAIER